jgi:hypothetical protein
MANPTTPPADEVKVESYQKAASIGGWAGAGRTLWALCTIGTVLGGAIGLVAPFFPVLALGTAAIPAAMEAVAASVAIFAGTGMSMGFAGGLMLGRISGTASAVAEESERRSKEWTIRQMKGIDPKYTPVPDAPEKQEEAPKTFGEKIRKAYYDYVNPRVGLTMTALGIVGGLILGAAFLSSGGAVGAVMGGTGLISSLTGIAATNITAPVILSYTAGVCGAFAATWFLNMPKITSKVTAMYGKLISGEPLGRKWGEDPAQAKAAAPDQPRPALQERSHEPAHATEMATNYQPPERSFGNYQELLTRQAQSASNQLAKG